MYLAGLVSDPLGLARIAFDGCASGVSVGFVNSSSGMLV